MSLAPCPQRWGAPGGGVGWREGEEGLVAQGLGVWLLLPSSSSRVLGSERPVPPKHCWKPRVAWPEGSWNSHVSSLQKQLHLSLSSVRVPAVARHFGPCLTGRRRWRPQTAGPCLRCPSRRLCCRPRGFLSSAQSCSEGAGEPRVAQETQRVITSFYFLME